MSIAICRSSEQQFFFFFFYVVCLAQLHMLFLRARFDPGTRERRALRQVRDLGFLGMVPPLRAGWGRRTGLEGLTWGPALRACKVVWLAAAQLIGLLTLTAAICLRRLALVDPSHRGTSPRRRRWVLAGEVRVFADDNGRPWRYEGSKGLLLFGLIVKGVVLCAGLRLVWLAADLLVSVAGAPRARRGPWRRSSSTIAVCRAIEGGDPEPAVGFGFAENATGETILYLRSFDDDTAVVFAPVASTRWYAPVLPQRVRFEELVEAWNVNEAARVAPRWGNLQASSVSLGATQVQVRPKLHCGHIIANRSRQSPSARQIRRIH